MDTTLQPHPGMATYKEDGKVLATAECIAALAYADYAADLSGSDVAREGIDKLVVGLEEAVDDGESRMSADIVDSLLILADPLRGQTEIGESAKCLLYKAGHCLDEARKVL